MPRTRIHRASRLPFHVFNQVNNRDWFQLPLDVTWRIFAQCLYEAQVCTGVETHAFLLMANHYHWLLTASDMELGEVMQFFARSVTRTFNLKSGRSGHLFRGRYQRTQIADPLHFENAYKYVYRNPVRAGVCERVEDYPHSSLAILRGEVAPCFALSNSREMPPDWLTRRGADLEWLNEPFKKELEEKIQRGLRKSIFELPPDRVGGKKKFAENLT